MRVDAIRGLTDSTTSDSSSQLYRTFTATGRADEELTGKLTQHYGFRSSPPIGTEVLTLQFGNNNYSVAENIPIPSEAQYPFVDYGDVVVYNNAGCMLRLSYSDGVGIVGLIGSDGTSEIGIGPGIMTLSTVNCNIFMEDQVEKKLTIEYAIGPDQTSIIVLNKDGLGQVSINGGNLTVDL